MVLDIVIGTNSHVVVYQCLGSPVYFSVKFIQSIPTYGTTFAIAVDIVGGSLAIAMGHSVVLENSALTTQISTHVYLSCGSFCGDLDNSDTDSNAGFIAGLAVLGVTVAVLLGIVAFLVCRQKKADTQLKQHLTPV